MSGTSPRPPTHRILQQEVGDFGGVFQLRAHASWTLDGIHPSDVQKGVRPGRPFEAGDRLAQAISRVAIDHCPGCTQTRLSFQAHEVENRVWLRAVWLGSMVWWHHTSSTPLPSSRPGLLGEGFPRNPSRRRLRPAQLRLWISALLPASGAQVPGLCSHNPALVS